MARLAKIAKTHKKPKFKVIEGDLGKDPYKWTPNKNNCMGACAMGGPAIEAFCRVIVDPDHRDFCFRNTLVSEAACMNMCRSIWP